MTHSRDKKKLHSYQSQGDNDKYANAFDVLRQEAKSTTKDMSKKFRGDNN